MKSIKYELLTETNIGTEAAPQLMQSVNAVELRCADTDLEVNLALAQSEAHGEITVEDIPEPATPPTPVEQLRADMDYIAIMTGVRL